MRGPKPKFPIQLTVEEAQVSKQLVNSRKTPQGKALRAKIIVLAHDHPDWSNQQIADECDCTPWAVRKWRRRWNEMRTIEDLPRVAARRSLPQVRV